jgi:crotonobetainyl-CoA:carnitine CoA-transferase CaiB-like acyl-CoA transferase
MQENRPSEHAGFGIEGAGMLRDMWAALGLQDTPLEHARATGDHDLSSVYAVTDLAAASVGAATLAISTLLSRRSGRVAGVQIERVLASRWFNRSIDPQGWTLPPAWDAIAGDYETNDGWIRLHTNAPLHRQAALCALGLSGRDADVNKETIAAAVRTCGARELETRVVAEGGCAAEMRSEAAWAEHPQGRAVCAEPLLAMRVLDTGAPQAAWPLQPARPLAGIRVLDLTRILAGPVATRYLASYGAQVLRIDPIDWDEPAVAPEITLGKRRARLDLRSHAGRGAFERLLSQADVLVHGYRSDALERMGPGEARRRELNPALVDVGLDAYGWTGAWRARRGFDSLVQMSTGIAHAGMTVLGRQVPTPLPVQALDHATGYMLAAAAVSGLIRRVDDGRGSAIRASLARTAAMLTSHSRPRQRENSGLPEKRDSDYATNVEHTSWGPARRLCPPYAIDGTPAFWTLAAGDLGDGFPDWPSA